MEKYLVVWEKSINFALRNQITNILNKTIMQRTLTFGVRPKDLSNDADMVCTIVKIGGINGLKFTMKNFKRIYGHDDSMPYMADLYLGKEHVAQCHNDGWGGDTHIYWVNTFDAERRAEVLQEVRKHKWCFKMPNEKKMYHITLNMSFVADLLSYQAEEDWKDTLDTEEYNKWYYNENIGEGRDIDVERQRD